MHGSNEPRTMVSTAAAFEKFHAILAYASRLQGCLIVPDMLYGKPRPDEVHILTPRGERGRLRVWELDPDNKRSTIEWDCLDTGGGWVDLTMMSLEEALKSIFEIPSRDQPTLETKERLQVPEF